MKKINNRKICFITVVNDSLSYDECLFYIENLEIPNEYEIEIRSIRNAKSLASAYNQAIKESDAKYKVYLHQDVFINNKKFIYDILKIFNDSNIGMIGLAGSKIMPINGIWWESKYLCGRVNDSITGRLKELFLGKVNGEYEKVKCIDGFLMVTQYDISWREDLFDGWHFYDTSQSLEFLKLGYDIVIPNQKQIWCTHDCGIIKLDNEYEKYRNVFLKEYYNLLSITN